MKKMILAVIAIVILASVPVVYGADNDSKSNQTITNASGTNAVIVQKDEYCKPVELVLKTIGWVAVEFIVIVAHPTLEPNIPRGM